MKATLRQKEEPAFEFKTFGIPKIGGVYRVRCLMIAWIVRPAPKIIALLWIKCNWLTGDCVSSTLLAITVFALFFFRFSNFSQVVIHLFRGSSSFYKCALFASFLCPSIKRYCLPAHCSQTVANTTDLNASTPRDSGEPHSSSLTLATDLDLSPVEVG